MLQPGHESGTPTTPGENDWVALASALGALELARREWPDDAKWVKAWADPILALTPRLLDAYAELWELSQGLLGAVEQAAAGSGLLVADSVEVQRFGR